MASFPGLMEKKVAMKDAMENINVGVRPKAKPKKVDEEADESPAKQKGENEKPNKYNTPRMKGESFEDYSKRLDKLQKEEE